MKLFTCDSNRSTNRTWTSAGTCSWSKRKSFHEKMYPRYECLLNFSQGFLLRFSQRHKLRHLVQHGAKLSANKPVAEDYAETFPDLVSKYSHDQIFNCDETGLNFRRMPGKSLVGSFEGRAEGRKKRSSDYQRLC